MRQCRQICRHRASQKRHARPQQHRRMLRLTIQNHVVRRVIKDKAVHIRTKFDINQKTSFGRFFLFQSNNYYFTVLLGNGLKTESMHRKRLPLPAISCEKKPFDSIMFVEKIS